MDVPSLQLTLRKYYENGNEASFKHELLYAKNYLRHIVSGSTNSTLHSLVDSIFSKLDNLEKFVLTSHDKSDRKELFILSSKIQFEIIRIRKINSLVNKFDLASLRTILENLYVEKFEHEFSKLNDENLIPFILPEWDKISSDETGWSHKTHHFRIDAHTLIAVSHLKKIPEFRDLDLFYRRVVTLALVFHDIGKNGGSKLLKGEVDSNHAERSARIAFKILSRLNYNKPILNLVYKLIKYHEILGFLTFKKHSPEELVYFQKKFFTLIGDYKLLDLLYIVSLADIFAVKRGGSFLGGVTYIPELESTSTKIDALKFRHAIGSSYLKKNTSSNLTSEKKIFLKTIFKDSYVKGHSNFMFFLVDNWFDVLKVVGTSGSSKKILHLLFEYETHIRKRGFSSLIELQNIRPKITREVLVECLHIPRIIEKYGFDQLLTLGKFNADYFKKNVSFISHILKPRESLILSNQDIYQTLVELFEISVIYRKLDSSIRFRAINQVIIRLEQEHDLISPSKQKMNELLVEEINFLLHKSSEPNISGLKNSKTTNVYFSTLRTVLNLDELVAIRNGAIPLCYYNCLEAKVLLLDLFDGYILPPRLRQFNISKKSRGYLKLISELRRSHLTKWQSSLSGVKVGGSETLSKHFLSEQKWFKFLGAPKPYNSKEDFFSIVAHYFSEDSVIVELKPDLYRNITWKHILFGGLNSSERDLVSFNKLTRDLVIKKPISLAEIVRIYCKPHLINFFKDTFAKLGLKAEVLSVESYDSVYRRQISELNLLLKDNNIYK